MQFYFIISPDIQCDVEADTFPKSLSGSCRRFGKVYQTMKMTGQTRNWLPLSEVFQYQVQKPNVHQKPHQLHQLLHRQAQPRMPPILHYISQSRLGLAPAHIHIHPTAPAYLEVPVHHPAQGQKHCLSLLPRTLYKQHLQPTPWRQIYKANTLMAAQLRLYYTRRLKNARFASFITRHG